MDISIIIPVYRVENYIENCILSVIRQTSTSLIECILVDDCGGDSSWEIVKRVVSEYKGNVIFRLIQHERNKGVSAARNTGLRNATGDYVFFLDSDDSISSDCLEKLSAPLKEYPYDFVFANNRYICDYPIEIPFLLPEGPIYNDKVIKKNFRDGWYAVVWNKLINREFIFRNNLFFEEGLIREDELWCFHMACVAKSMYVLPDVTYDYVYDNPQSIMSDKGSVRHFNAFTEVLKKEIGLVKKYNLEKNIHLYYQIEEAKRWRMKDAMRLLTKKEIFSYYKDLRKIHYVNPLFLSFDFKYTIKNLVRDIHYLLPSYLGFRYMNLLNVLSH